MSTLLLMMLTASAGELQPPGLFRSDEVVAHDGEDWLALGEGLAGWSLTRVKTAVMPAFDPRRDRPREAGSVEVVPADGAAAVVLVKGVPGLAPGAVPDVAAQLVPAPPWDSAEPGWDLQVGTDRVRMLPWRGGAGPVLLWSGDLDGDGAADALVDEVLVDGRTATRLWLSSVQRVVAEHTGAGG